jgi:hypothetical protein
VGHASIGWSVYSLIRGAWKAKGKKEGVKWESKEIVHLPQSTKEKKAAREHTSTKRKEGDNPSS